MSSIDEIWESMNADVPKVTLAKEKKKKKKTDTLNKEEKQKKSNEKKNEAQKVIQSILSSSSSSSVISPPSSTNSPDISNQPKTLLKAPRKAEVISTLNDSDTKRKKAMLKYLLEYIIEQNNILINQENSVIPSSHSHHHHHYNPNDLLHDYGKLLFQFFTDPNDSCRELSFQICTELFKTSTDFSPILPYYFSSLFHHMPPSISYDTELQVFVFNKELHEDYKRGKAVERQDRFLTSPTPTSTSYTPSGSGSGSSSLSLLKISPSVLEPSEEIRLKSMISLQVLIERIINLSCSSILHSYFSDIILYLQYFLIDTYTNIVEVILEIFILLSNNIEFNLGMKFFSVGLCRQILLTLRNRHWKVRALGIQALACVFSVPNYEKRKAAGSDCIKDIIGFEEENVLSVSSFYKNDVRINYLAELVSDHNITVKLNLLNFLHKVLVEIDDRYDHQTRFLPYLLDLLTDSSPEISSKALGILELCGKEYESEHFEEIIEKKQYGVDGDNRMNIKKKPIYPFQSRPSIGVRLYVRGNTKRFLYALINELTNWQSKTRLKSASLLRVIFFMCEESLAIESYKLLPNLIKALKFAIDDNDVELLKLLEESYEILGRFMNPDVYFYYLLPRLRGDKEIISSNTIQNELKLLIKFTNYLVSGSLIKEILPFLNDLVTILLNNPIIIDDENLQYEVLILLNTLFNNLYDNYYLKNNNLYNEILLWKEKNFLLFEKLFEFCLSNFFISSSHSSTLSHNNPAHTSSTSNSSSTSSTSSQTNLTLSINLLNVLSQIYTNKKDLNESKLEFYNVFSVKLGENIINNHYKINLDDEVFYFNNKLLNIRKKYHKILINLICNPYNILQKNESFILIFTKFLYNLFNDLLTNNEINNLNNVFLLIFYDLIELLLLFYSPILLSYYLLLSDSSYQLYNLLYSEYSSLVSTSSSTSFSSSSPAGSSFYFKFDDIFSSTSSSTSRSSSFTSSTTIQFIKGIDIKESINFIKLLKDIFNNNKINFINIILNNSTFINNNTNVLLLKFKIFLLFNNIYENYLNNYKYFLFYSSFSYLFLLKNSSSDIYYNINLSNFVLNKLLLINNNDDNHHHLKFNEDINDFITSSSDSSKSDCSVKSQFYSIHYILSNFSCYEDNIFSLLLSPSQLPAIRSLCLQYLISYGQSIVKLFNLKRLKSIKYYKKKLSPLNYSNILYYQNLSSNLLVLILECLNDSNDDIRRKCLESFYSNDYSLILLLNFDTINKEIHEKTEENLSKDIAKKEENSPTNLFIYEFDELSLNNNNSNIIKLNNHININNNLLYKNLFNKIISIYINEIDSISNDELLHTGEDDDIEVLSSHLSSSSSISPPTSSSLSIASTSPSTILPASAPTPSQPISTVSSLDNSSLPESSPSLGIDSYTKLFISSELALRSLCILCPSTFDNLLKEYIEENNLDLLSSPLLYDSIQALFNHCHVLASLE